jgi:hypothetical protein
MKEVFKPRFFLLYKDGQKTYLKWKTIEGVISVEARNNPDHITYLMAQDIWDIYGRDYDITVISEKEYKANKGT